jgi:pre-rRNA-processing protein TSR3
MKQFPRTIILRHCRENLKKCTLTPLENREDFLFFTYPKDLLPDLTQYVLLTLDAPVLSKRDSDKGIFLIDATWRYAEKMYRQLPLPHRFEKRSLPHKTQTAYPRKQTDCPDPKRGLASIEALYLAYRLLDRDPKGMLDHYHWAVDFLASFPVD